MAPYVNTIGDFKRGFDRMLENLFIDRTEGNEEIQKRVMNDEVFRSSRVPDAGWYSRLRRKKTTHILADRSSHMVT
jgi:hypothetical protein